MATANSWAQDLWSLGSGRPSIAGSEAAAARQKSSLNESYNLQIGPIRFSLSSTFRAEFNDNTNLSQTSPQSDIILEPHLYLNGVWPITKVNDLHINLGIGFISYLLHNDRPGSNTVAIDPGSDVNFDLFIDDSLRLNFHDRFFISYDPVDQATLSNVRDFGRFENIGGVTAIWDMNAIIVRATYDHYNYVSLTSEFNYLNRNAEIFKPSIAYTVTEAILAGFDGSVMVSYYSQNFLNDSTMISAGPWLETSFGRYLKLRAAAGYQGGYFYGGGGGNSNNSNLTGWFGNLSMAHRINSSLTQRLAAGHEEMLGLNANYETIDYVRYSLDTSAIRAIPTSFYVFYEHVSDSPDIQSQTLDRAGVGIHFAYRLSSKATLGLDYQFLKKNSNLQDFDYTQNRVFLTSNYQF